MGYYIDGIEQTIKIAPDIAKSTVNVIAIV